MLSGEGCCVRLGHDAPQLHTGVSVGQLRSALLQQTGAQPDKVYAHLHVCVIILRASVFAFASTFSSLSPLPALRAAASCPDAGRATSSLDLAVKPGAEGGRRRTRRYHPDGPGGGRKTSERFRTQPITANEVEESSG